MKSMLLIPLSDRLKLLFHGYMNYLSIAQCYQCGHIVEKNSELAKKLYHLALYSGDNRAFFYLGRYYEKLNRNEIALKTYIAGAYKENLASIERLKQWANKKYLDASYALGRYFESKQDVSQAIEYYSQAATLGHSIAMYHLGELLFSHKSKQDGIFWFNQAALLNLPHGLNKLIALAQTEPLAAFYMAELYESNKSAPAKNEEQAIHYYKLSSQLDNKHAAYRLGILLREYAIKDAMEYTLIAALKQHKEALTDLKTLASSGDPDAQFACFKYFRKIQDSTQAVTWLLKAVEQNYSEAKRLLDEKNWNVIYCMAIARLYDEGVDITQGVPQAKRFYERAANLGNREAAFRLAQLLRTNTPVLQSDLEKACDYYLIAARLGYQKAIVPLESLGEISNANTQIKIGRFFKEIGNFAKATKWDEKSAEAEPLAQQSHKGLLK